MELTSKQRAQLRSMAAGLDTILHVGKDGIGDNLIKQADDALEARELIKGRVLENSMLTAREAAEALAPLCRCEVVQVIGSKFVLFRYQHDKAKRKIEPVKSAKRGAGQ
ncbi:MAG: ribosome assembly RNA-binding protein YhbY [Oscillospiraceae bacterium]|nr:ribosome assembly RNA-binding protein YhbY [Oscillospiraceae bacterium]